MLRRVAELASRGVVLRRRLPAEFGSGRLYVTPDAGLRFWKPGLAHADPMLLRWARDFIPPGTTVWDIGANVGLFSFAAASRAGTSGQVFSVEADAWLATLLRRSSSVAPKTSASVEIVCVAVSSHLGVAKFAVAARGRCASFLEVAEGSASAGGVRESVRVVTVTLDWLLEQLPPPQFVKIDIEGAELLALQGASKLLHLVRPTIICEIGKNQTEIATLLRAAGYELFEAEDPSYPRVSDGLPFNTLARPIAKT